MQLFKSYCYQIYERTYFGVIHPSIPSGNLPSVIVVHSNAMLLFLHKLAPCSLAFAMISADHITVVFPKSVYSLMSRVTPSPNSIIPAIVNSDVHLLLC